MSLFVCECFVFLFLLVKLFARVFLCISVCVYLFNLVYLRCLFEWMCVFCVCFMFESVNLLMCEFVYGCNCGILYVFWKYMWIYVFLYMCMFTYLCICVGVCICLRLCEYVNFCEYLWMYECVWLWPNKVNCVWMRVWLY